MSDSEGVFGKRRRNLLIVSVIIILLSFLNPNLDEVTLFGIKFQFDGKIWLIWLGLTFWFFYTSMRVYSFYNSFLKRDVMARQNLFIYWEDGGADYWVAFIKFKSNELTKKNIFKYNFTSEPRGEMKKLVEKAKIPGENLFQFNGEIIEKISFIPDKKMAKEFKKRKRQYRLRDEWWEYKFIFFFGIVSFCFLILGWLRVFSLVF